MNGEPIVSTFTTYRCPNCGSVYVSREDYDSHVCDTSPELVAKAESMVGEWVVVASEKICAAGEVVGSDGARVIVRGFIANSHGSVTHISPYERYGVHVSDVRDASGPRNAMLILDSLVRAGLRDRFVARFPEAGGEDE